MNSSQDLEAEICNICQGKTEFRFSNVILNKYPAQYFQCVDCEYLFTKSEEWIDEAYGEAISTLDVGLVERNLRVSRELRWLLKLLKLESKPILDFAGGTGLLTRLMRDRGFHFHWSDKYARNLHARGFEEQADISYSALTLIEVLEHVSKPLNFLTDLKNQHQSQTYIFSQELLTLPIDSQWWYFIPESGQHISFYTTKTLKRIASQLDMHLTKFDTLYFFAPKKYQNSLKFYIFLFVCKFERLLQLLSVGRGSLIGQDFNQQVSKSKRKNM